MAFPLNENVKHKKWRFKVNLMRINAKTLVS